MITTDASTRLSDQSIDVLTFLSTRGSIWPSACQAAIRDLFARFREDTQPNNEQVSFPSKAPKESDGTEWVEHHIALPGDVTTTSNAQSQSSPRLGASGINFPRPQQNYAFADANFETMLASASNRNETDLSLFAGFDIPFWLEVDDVFGVEM